MNGFEERRAQRRVPIDSLLAEVDWLRGEVERLREIASLYAVDINGPVGPCPRCDDALGLCFDHPESGAVTCLVCGSKFTERDGVLADQV